MKSIRIRTRIAPGGHLPSYQTSGSAGMDIAAAEKALIRPGAFRAVSTGVFLEIPPGHECQVRPRSGFALRAGIGILNSPGTIDSDYRGEIKVILFNFGPKAVTVKPGDRIAQIVFTRVARVRLAQSRGLSKTMRGSGGFGHTGI